MHAEAINTEALTTLSESLKQELGLTQRAYAMNYTANFTDLNLFFHLIEGQLPNIEKIFSASDSAINTDTAIEQLQATLETSGTHWFLHVMLCYYAAVHRDQFDQATQHMIAASQAPEAPAKLKQLAQRMQELLNKTGEADNSKMLNELNIVSRIQKIQAQVDQFFKENGRYPESVDPFLEAEDCEGIDAQLVIDPTSGKVMTSEHLLRQTRATERAQRINVLARYEPTAFEQPDS